MKKKKAVFIDLFAGCGGMSLGLENAGFYPVFVNELNKDAMDTYLVNRTISNPLLAKKYHCYDVKEMVLTPNYFDDLKDGLKRDYGLDVGGGEVDLIVGGPPCQGFSVIGHRRSYSVEKRQLPSNHLYQDMAYVINQVRPKLFLFENVRGLLHSRWTEAGTKGEIWEGVKSVLSSIPGYRTDYALVFAKDYGVPQSRPRVLLVGIREDISIKHPVTSNAVAGGYLPSPTGVYPDLVDLLSDLIDPDYENGGVTSAYPSGIRSALQRKLRYNPVTEEFAKKGDCLTEHEYSVHSSRIIRKFNYMLSHNGNIPNDLRTKKFDQRVLLGKWDEKGPTITATSMPDDYVHYSQPRTLTVREWARLQLFPDWYQFKGNRTTGGLRRAGNPQVGIFNRELPKYTQVGNAVPVGLAEIIGKHFLKLLNLA